MVGCLKKGHVNRVVSSRTDAGGKGINVSKVLKSLNVSSIAMGFLGQRNAKFFLDYLKDMGIENKFYILDGESRTNIKIVEAEGSICTDINETGFHVKESDMEAFTTMLLDMVKTDDIVVLSGSIPPGVHKGIYRDMIHDLNKMGARTIVDADGEALKQAIDASPYALKPNIKELSTIIKINEDDMNSIICGARALLQKGINTVLLTLGDRGALYVNDKLCLYAHPIAVDVKSTVGAGDAAVSALAYSIQQGLRELDTLKLACACATACVMTEGTGVPPYELIYKLIDKVVVEEFIGLSCVDFTAI